MDNKNGRKSNWSHILQYWKKCVERKRERGNPKISLPAWHDSFFLPSPPQSWRRKKTGEQKRMTSPLQELWLKIHFLFLFIRKIFTNADGEKGSEKKPRIRQEKLRRKGSSLQFDLLPDASIENERPRENWKIFIRVPNCTLAEKRDLAHKCNIKLTA